MIYIANKVILAVNSLIRKWGEQVIRKPQYAATLALVFAFLSFFDLPVGWLSSVIIALVTLQNGPRRGLTIMSWAILPAVAMLCLGNYAIFVNVLFLHFLLAWGFAAGLRQFQSWMTLLKIGAGVGVIATVFIYFFAPDLQNWLITQLATFAKEYQAASIFKISSSDIDNWLNYFNLFATGLLVLVIIMTNLFTVFLARWWQSNVVPGINLQKECQQVRSHYLAAILLLIVAGSFYFNGSLFFNVLVVAIMPFVFSGLSIVHAFSATKKNGSLFLFVFYALFLLLSPYLMLLLATIGWLDSFLDFRKKFIVENVVEE